MTYGHCVYHKIECDYPGLCRKCPHNTEKDAQWFKEQDGEWFEHEVDETDEVLNKIRAEIEKEIVPRNSEQYDYESKWQNLGLIMALKVINKYKAERSKET